VHIEIRPLFAPDFTNGFVETLSALKPIPSEWDKLVPIFQHRLRSGIRTLVALLEGKVVGTAAILIEPKFYGTVGHVEDVAVHPEHQKKGIGARLMDAIHEEAAKAGCYKIILDCEDHNIPFYEKLGYFKNCNHMRKNL
jgi:glucosamine-phosphate N-acetyltransferase